jgi:hypothetical protein
MSDLMRRKLKNELSYCTEDQKLIFKRMYSHNNLELDINTVVDNMIDEKLDWAIRHVEATLKG